jgi:hypothetical protein
MSAWPSLSGDRGYKLKKPVTTDLVDLVDLVARAGGWRRAGGRWSSTAGSRSTSTSRSAVSPTPDPGGGPRAVRQPSSTSSSCAACPRTGGWRASSAPAPRWRGVLRTPGRGRRGVPRGGAARFIRRAGALVPAGGGEDARRGPREDRHGCVGRPTRAALPPERGVPWRAAAGGTFGSSARPPDRLAFWHEPASRGGVDTGVPHPPVHPGPPDEPGSS